MAISGGKGLRGGFTLPDRSQLVGSMALEVVTVARKGLCFLATHPRS